MTGLLQKAKNARIASLKLQSASLEERNKALSMIQEILMSQKEAIGQLNGLDLEVFVKIH
jgi:gamma-glutamyl phosphate reductase